MLLQTKARVAAGLVAFTALTARAESITTLDKVVIVATEQDLDARRRTPNSKLVFGRRQIERFGDRTLGEVLRRLPGVTFGGPPGESKDVRLRGFDKEYTQLLIDGRRVPGGGEKREFQVDRLPADLVERIEIIRTPTANIDSQGVAGTINIVLRKTPKHRVASASVGSVYLGGTGSRPNGAIVVGDQIGDFDYLFSLNAQKRLLQKDKNKNKNTFKADGALDKAEREDERKDLDEINFAPRFGWSLSDQDRVRIEPLLLYSDEHKDKTKLKFKGDGASDGSELEDEDKTRTGWAVNSAWEHGFDADSEITLGLTVQQNNEDKDKSKLKFKGDGNLDKTELENETKTDREILVSLIGNTRFAQRHTMQAGLEFTDKGRKKNKRKTEERNGTTSDKTGPKDNFSFDEQLVNLFFQDEFAISEAHVLTPGLRMEWVNQKGTDGSGRSDSDSNLQWIPSLHYLFHLSERANLRASVARTLRRPKFDDLSPVLETRDGTLDKPDKVGNPGLRPETALGFDAGVEYFLQHGAAVLGINGFYRDIKDKIEKQVDINDATGRFEEMPANVGDATLYGVELDAKGRMDFIGLPALALRGNFSWLGSRVTDPMTGRKRQFKDQPDYVLNAGFDYALANWGLSFGANYNRVSETEKDEIKGGKRTIERQQHQDRLDFYALKPLGKGLRLRFSAENLLRAAKDKYRTILKADRNIDRMERDVERSRRAFLVTLEGQW